MSGFLVNASLISLLTLIAILALRLHRLFAVVMLSGAFSLVAATLFVVLDAVDVGLTARCLFELSKSTLIVTQHGLGCTSQRQIAIVIV